MIWGFLRDSRVVFGVASCDDAFAYGVVETITGVVAVVLDRSCRLLVGLEFAAGWLKAFSYRNVKSKINLTIMCFECGFEKTFCPALRSTSSCPYSPNRQYLKICKPSFCPSPSTLPVFGPSGTSTLLLRETCRLQILLRIHILFKKKYFHFHTFIPQSRYIYFFN
jgi:hypothetical protein